jgi:hypothetical protein
MPPFDFLKSVGLLAADATRDLWDRWVDGDCGPLLRKAGVNDRHPGWPPKSPNGLGGKFRPNDATPGIGHNGGPPLEEGGKLRVTGKMRSSAVKIAIRALARGGLIATGILAPEALLAIGVGIEVAEVVYPYIKAYLDAPQSLEALQEGAKFPEPGYDIHHIVEQATAAADGSETAQIQGPDNLVRISTVKHWDLNRWYATKNEAYGNMSPRDYVKGKSLDERRRVGLDGLRDI